MNWADRYIQLPFKDGGRTREGVDCWGLVRLVYQDELGIELPSYGDISAEDLIRVSRRIDAGKDGETWSDTDTPMQFDVCVMRFIGSKRIGHVGVMLSDREMIHIEAGMDAACVPIKHFTVTRRIACFRRHRQTIR